MAVITAAASSQMLSLPAVRAGAGSQRAAGSLLPLRCRSRHFGVRMQPTRAMLQLPERLAEHLPAHLPSSLDQLAQQTTRLSLTLADITNAASADPATQAVVDAGDTAAKNGGFFGPIATLFESVLKVLDSMLASVGVPYSYGFAIILLTIGVKVVTYPLTKKQVETTLQTQSLQPKIKIINERFKNDAEKKQMEIARLYQETGINPLAGCLPTLATIPVFIGLYRALSNVAEEGLLSDGFFWIPSLGGPTTLAAQKAGGGFSWLLPLVDGSPPIGWSDALAYLSLPVLLVLSQYAATKIMSPPSNDPAQQQTQWILKFLPLMIGWFSLNVPSGLALYWFTNNILSTSQQVYLRRNLAPDTGSSATTILPPDAEQERLERVRKLTGQSTQSQPQSQSSAVNDDPRGKKKKKGDKFRALKAEEAARKQRAQGGGASDGAAAQNSQEPQKQEQKQNQD